MNSLIWLDEHVMEVNTISQLLKLIMLYGNQKPFMYESLVTELSCRNKIQFCIPFLSLSFQIKCYFYSFRKTSNLNMPSRTLVTLILYKIQDQVKVMVFNATFNNILAISWQSVLLVKEPIVPEGNHRPVANH